MEKKNQAHGQKERKESSSGELLPKFSSLGITMVYSSAAFMRRLCSKPPDQVVVDQKCEWDDALKALQYADVASHKKSRTDANRGTDHG